MSEKSARYRPVDTILSGPAASVIGGLVLTNNKNGIVVDMGGTTTDIACVSKGNVRIKKERANIGGWFTRVRAADIFTFGVGGDSRIYLDINRDIKIGPQKVIPLCVVGKEYPELIHEIKSFRRVGDMKSFWGHEADCYMYLSGQTSTEITGKDNKIIESLKERPHSITYLAKIAGKDPEKLDLTQMVEEGVIARIGVTPTDILHVQGKYNKWDRNISNKGIQILAKRCEKNAKDFISETERMIRLHIATSVIQAVANFEEEEISLKESVAAMYILKNAFEKHTSYMIDTKIRLKKPLIAIGAPAKVWLNDAAELLNAEIVLPEDADVANAYGAAVGQVTENIEIIINLHHGRYILNLPWSSSEYETKEEAMFFAIHEGRKYIEHVLADAGCRRWKIDEDISDMMVDIPFMEGIGENERKMYAGTRMILKGVGDGMI